MIEIIFSKFVRKKKSYYFSKRLSQLIELFFCFGRFASARGKKYLSFQKMLVRVRVGPRKCLRQDPETG